MSRFPKVRNEKVIDTLKISRAIYGNCLKGAISNYNLKSYAMRELLPFFSSLGHHRLDHDVKVTAEVFVSMMGKVVEG